MYLEAELRTLQQGDMSINDYCTKLKTLADGMRDIGFPVSESSQVLNLLRDLNPKYRHLKPTIKAKFPPHTFASARSYLLLEELCEKHDAKEEAGQALYASDSGSRGGDGAGGNRYKPRQKKRGFGSNSGSGSSNGGNSGGNNGSRGRIADGGAGSAGTGTGGGQHQPNLPWAAGYNPWTGLVQAWPINFHAPGSGSRPTTSLPAAAGYDGPTPDGPNQHNGVFVYLSLGSLCSALDSVFCRDVQPAAAQR